MIAVIQSTAFAVDFYSQISVCFTCAVKTNNMLREIASFIDKNKVATICGIGEDHAPYCFNCFYAFDAKNQLLFFKSSSTSNHSKILLKNERVSGTILPDKLELLAIKGIQFSGKVLYDSFPGQIRPEVSYHKRFPLALAKPGDVWCIQLEMVKMTDNTQVFGKKTEWVKQPC